MSETGASSDKSGLINIRPAIEADAQQFRKCVAEAYSRYIGRLGKKPGPMLDDYQQVIREENAFVAETDGTVVGILVLKSRDGKPLLDNVAVMPGYAGRGIGKQLMRFAEEFSLEQGFDVLSLYTHERMTENIELYLTHGYVETHRIEESGFNRVYMQKQLHLEND